MTRHLHCWFGAHDWQTSPCIGPGAVVRRACFCGARQEMQCEETADGYAVPFPNRWTTITPFGHMPPPCVVARWLSFDDTPIKISRTIMEQIGR